jgi:hypothetical protein
VLVLAFAAGLPWLSAGSAAPVALATETRRGEHDGEVRAVESGAMHDLVAGSDLPVRPTRSDRAPATEQVDLPPERVLALVEDLRDDHIAGNAGAAMIRLASARGAARALEPALESFDVQHRHLAARVLRQRCDQHGEEPSSRLLDVSVEALAHRLEMQLRERRLTVDWDPSADATRFLATRVVSARPALRRALDSGDDQQRFLAAFLLSEHADEADVAAISRELLPRLAHNDVRGDAVMAAHGLYLLGHRALPAMRWWKSYVDEQARSLLELIELDLTTPPRSRADIRARARLQQVTRIYHDPAIEFDVLRSRVPSWGTH